MTRPVELRIDGRLTADSTAAYRHALLTQLGRAVPGATRRAVVLTLGVHDLEGIGEHRSEVVHVVADGRSRRTTSGRRRAGIAQLGALAEIWPPHLVLTGAGVVALVSVALLPRVVHQAEQIPATV